jgi:cation-transporting ATPase E
LESMNDRALTRRWDWILWLIVSFGLVATLAGFLRHRLRQARRQQKPLQAGLAPDLQQFQGLSEAEAVERHSPLLTQKREQEARQVRRDIWRSRTLSIFNLSLLALAAVRALLGDPLGAWLTFGILILNIGVSVGQQLYATRQLEKLMELVRPLVTAIRDGRIRSIDVDEIVIGDLLVVGSGGAFLTDGELLSGRPRVIEARDGTGYDQEIHKKEGDLILAGSQCVWGRAVYRVTALPDDLGTQRWTPVQRMAELTPLQRIIVRILRLMLVIIAVFLALFLLDWINSPILSRVFESMYREVATIIFSISASGLFFMIVATYALGSARLGGLGALIREAQAIESLAQVSVLCISKAGALKSAHVHLDMLPSVKGLPFLAESRTRQLIGNLAHSATVDNSFIQALSDNFAGSKRPVEQAAWLLSAHGWSAVTFSEAGVPGTFVIGEPTILQPQLVELQVPVESGAASAKGGSGLRDGISHLGRFFKRNDQRDYDVADDAVALIGSTVGSEDDQPDSSRQESDPATAPDGDVSTALVTRRGRIFQGLRFRLDNFRKSDQDLETEETQELETDPPLPRLLFAYTPEPKALFDVDGQPQLPFDLIPLCTLTFVEQIQPQAIEAVRTFTEAGVNVKILSSDDPERVLATAERLGLIENEPTLQAVISGLQLAQMNERQFEQAVKEATVLGQLSREQKREVVRTLRQLKEQVAMVGDRVDDVPAMEAANLSITLRSSSQVALSSADIVLLEDSLQVLPTVLQQGQRIVNGLLDILKINLTQIGYVLLLIVVMAVTGKRIFYYNGTQGGVIAFFTIIGPSVGLTLWSSARALPLQYMRSRLVHFAVPAAISMAVATLVINQFVGLANFNTIYSQLAVTYGLIMIGLLLVLFVQPPTRFWVGGDVLGGDRRIIYMVIVLFLVFIAATHIPLTQRWFRLAPLEDVTDYLVLGAISVLWLLVARAIWRAPWLRRRAGI